MSTEEIMHELNNKTYGIINIFGTEIWLTQTLIVTWVWMLILIGFCIIVNTRLEKWSKNDKPRGFQNFVELIVEGMDSYVIEIMGSKYKYFGSYFFGVFLLILCFNFSGMIIQRPPTADIATTAAFASVTFILIHFMGIFKGGTHYFKEYASPSILMAPLHIISEIATPVSLSFRLFGATLGGYIIIVLCYALFPVILKIGFPVILHSYFDIFAGILQAFIFVTLSMTFISGKLPDD